MLVHVLRGMCGTVPGSVLGGEGTDGTAVVRAILVIWMPTVAAARTGHAGVAGDATEQSRPF
jgi:hypothetical protein